MYCMPLLMFSLFLSGGFFSLLEDKELGAKLFKVFFVLFFIGVNTMGLIQAFATSSLNGYLGIAGMIMGGVLGYLWGRELRL